MSFLESIKLDHKGSSLFSRNSNINSKSLYIPNLLVANEVLCEAVSDRILNCFQFKLYKQSVIQ